MKLILAELLHRHWPKYEFLRMAHLKIILSMSLLVLQNLNIIGNLNLPSSSDYAVPRIRLDINVDLIGLTQTLLFW